LKIYLKYSNEGKITLPIPFRLLILGLDITPYIMKKTSRYLSDQQREVLDCIDFKVLAKSMKVLKRYRGLKIVEIRSKEGEEISITIWEQINKHCNCSAYLFKRLALFLISNSSVSFVVSITILWGIDFPFSSTKTNVMNPSETRVSESFIVIFP